MFLVERGKNRTFFLEVVHVFVLVVRRAIFPAPEKDPNPFEGQGANDRVKFFTFGRVEIDIVTNIVGLASYTHQPGAKVVVSGR